MSTSVKYTINYTYKGKIRQAEVSVVGVPSDTNYYWFYFRNRPPEVLSKRNGVWLLGNVRPITDEIERSDLWRALTAALDEQVIKPS